MIFQKTVSSIVLILGLFVIFSVTNNITGRVVGENGSSLTLLDLAVVFWAGLLLAAGIWMWYNKEFYHSVIKDN